MSRFPSGIEDDQLASGLAQAFLGEEDAYVDSHAEGLLDSPEFETVKNAFMWLMQKRNSDIAADGMIHFIDQYTLVDVDEVAEEFIKRAQRKVKLGIRNR